MEENKNALDEVNKGCTMGIEAINAVLEKVSNVDFKNDLEEELKDYDKVEGKIHAIYDKYSKDEPHERGTITKVMKDMMMNMKTMIDYTDSKIAEILSQGTNMGVIEEDKIIKNKKTNS